MKKISVSLSGHRTSVSLEKEFADALRRIAAAQNKPVAEIIAEIDAARVSGGIPSGGLSAAVRVFVLEYFMKP
jgi:predicted DNA-binding ribbon-helix-helix protein